MPNCTGGKSSWPELVGAYGQVAVEVIKSENPCLVEVVTVLEGTGVSEDLRFDRVRVWVNTEGKVIHIPKIG